MGGEPYRVDVPMGELTLVVLRQRGFFSLRLLDDTRTYVTRHLPLSWTEAEDVVRGRSVELAGFLPPYKLLQENGVLTMRHGVSAVSGEATGLRAALAAMGVEPDPFG